MASRTNTPRASGPLPRFRWSLLAFLLLAFSASSFAQSHRQNFDIAKGPAESTLKTLASQSGLEILFSSRTAGSTETNEVRGQMTADEALDQMLAGTGLVARKNSKTGAVTVSLEPKNESRAAENPDRPGQNREYYEKKVVLDTFEVMGSKLLNMDLPRSRDDAQPYVVFGRELLERSGATSLDDFLKQRVTMNTQGQSPSQFLNSLSGNTSSINLRGLGAEQTLILVDGREWPDSAGHQRDSSLRHRADRDPPDHRVRHLRWRRDGRRDQHRAAPRLCRGRASAQLRQHIRFRLRHPHGRALRRLHA
jgi:hypothetical protein